MGIFTRLRNRVHHRRHAEELQEELRVHEDMKREALRAAGKSERDAAVEARRALGNVTLMREDARRVWIAPWIDSVAQDARYGLRAIVRQPLHALTSITVLVLAIGLATSLFTMFKALMLHPWPADRPEQIVHIRARAKGQVIAPSYDEYRFLREQAKTLQGTAAIVYGASHRVEVPGRTEVFAQTQFVSASFFPTLRAGFELGAGFLPDDDRPGRRQVAVISHYLWRSHFGSDPGILTRAVTIDGKPFTIIGVLDRKVDGLSREVPLWLPFSMLPAMGPVSSAGIEGAATGHCCMQAVGRLADGVSAERAALELQMLHERFALTTERPAGQVEVHGTPAIAQPNAGGFELMGALAAAIGLVVVLACANVGNLQLARGLARRREIATRLAIGASRARVVRQLLVEAMVLATIAGAASIAVAAVLPGAVMALLGDEIPPGIADRFAPDAKVMLFAGLISAIACLTFALAPALNATRATIPLGTMDRGGTKGARFVLRSAFLAVQIAACTVLLAGAGLVTRAIMHAVALDPGFSTEGLVRVFPYLPSGTPSAAQETFRKQLLLQFESGDRPVALVGHAPMSNAPFKTRLLLPADGPTDARWAMRRNGSARYFEVLGLPIVKGRMYKSDAVDEVVINESFVRLHWRGEDPVGQTLREMDNKGTIARSLTVVGVVKDAYLTGLERIEPVIFKPATSGSFLVRGAADAERVRAAAAGLNPAATIRTTPISEDIDNLLAEPRLGAAVAWVIGLLALALAAVGVFGVFAYAVEERKREIGVRLALGAAGRQIVRMLIATSGRAMLIGVGIGLLGSLACGPVLGSYLFGLSPLDPLAYAMMLSILLLAGLLATLVPARRACRVDPAVTLRED